MRRQSASLRNRQENARYKAYFLRLSQASGRHGTRLLFSRLNND
jgi:hypothetical protein